MRIAIFENEYNSVRGAFEAANLLSFNSDLDIVNFQSSQKADLTRISEFEVIFIDIDLSSKSELDGFTLIQKLITSDPKLKERIIILTGNNRISEALGARNMDAESIKVIIKPTDYDEITKAIRSVSPLTG